MLETLTTRKEALEKRGKKGFTLMEMLIVIAIIAILIAIAIPIFTQQLAKANAATDAANIRSGYAQVQSDIILKNIKSDSATLQSDGVVKWETSDNNTETSFKGNYKTVGDSENLTESANIGGVGAEWDEGQKVVYEVDANGKISSIAGAAYTAS